MDRRAEAKQTLVHYFRIATGRLDSDNVVEIEGIVDDIIDAAVEAVKDEIRADVRKGGEAL